jgi:hypothetical protein
MNGGITFYCIFCEHSVSTMDFDHAKGNRRTQAAAAMNQHARESHPVQTAEHTPHKQIG